jgi:hypothetical protein
MYWDEPSRKTKRVNNVLRQAGLFFLIASILFFTNAYIRLNLFSLPFLLIVLGSTFLPLITGRSVVTKQASEIADNPDNNSIFKEILLSVTEEELLVKSSLVESKFNWKGFTKKTEIKEYYYLFKNSMQAIIIPKRAFTNNEEKLAFDKILSRNLSLDAEIKDAIK